MVTKSDLVVARPSNAARRWRSAKVTKRKKYTVALAVWNQAQEMSS